MGGPEILTAAPAGAAERDLIDQNVWGAIRTLWEKGRSRKAIARELDLDIKTVRKWLRRSWDQQRRRRGRRLDGFVEFLKGRAPEVGFNAVVLTRELAGRGYAGSYSGGQVRRAVAQGVARGAGTDGAVRDGSR